MKQKGGARGGGGWKWKPQGSILTRWNWGGGVGTGSHRVPNSGCGSRRHSTC